MPQLQQRRARSLLSVLIDKKILLPRDRLTYRGSTSEATRGKESIVTGGGVKWTCCNKAFTVEEFAAHCSGGRHAEPPWARLFLKAHRSLEQCLRQAMQRDSFVTNNAWMMPVRRKSACSDPDRDSICSVCFDGGERLLACEQCPSAFHANCLGLQGVPRGCWCCPSCRCVVCDGSEFNPSVSRFAKDTVMYCVQCERQCVKQIVPSGTVFNRDPMPLLKRTPFSLLEPPKNLDPKEKVFQVRFTKEIFRDYQEYLKRLNLYRQKVWTCKVSGKSNLTYEEALICEQRAAEKAQQMPKELIAPVLRMIQHSTLSLTDLVEKIYSSLLLDLFEGLELHVKRDDSETACKILKVISSGNTKLYEVGWVGQDNAAINTSVVKSDDLMRKKAPVSRNTLKMFIRESTSKSSPWILHENLAKKYGVPTELTEDIMNGEGLCKAGKRLENGATEDARKKFKKDEMAESPVKYPVDDLLVEPEAKDLSLSKRPPLSTDFRVPIESVGDLLMVWDFCLSFGRLICLSPFSLSDLENAICYKESNLVLLVELHAALFHLLIKDGGAYFEYLQNKKRKLKVTLVKWADYLCDFMDMMGNEEFSCKLSTVRRGHYGLLDTGLKLKILRVLVDEVIMTSAVREKIDEWIGQRQALAAEKREDARKNGKEQKVNMEGVAENRINQSEATQNDNGSVKGQHGGIEHKEKRFSSSKKGEQKMYLRRHLETEMQQQSLWPNPLGKDRFYNRYWFFGREGRLFVESADSKEWGYYSTKEELDALVGSFNVKGIRERTLKQQLNKSYDKISNALEKRMDVEQKMLLEEAVLRRSTRVHAQPKDENPCTSFLKYVNKWKQK